MANIAIDPPLVGKADSYAGWSLVVVYEDASLSPGEVTLYDGALSLSSRVSKDLAFTGQGGVLARIGVVTWEGDRGITGGSVKLNADDDGEGGERLTPMQFTDPELGVPTWVPHDVEDPDYVDNAFDSTATGFKYPNSLGVDAKAFKEQELGAGTNKLTFGTDGHAYLLSAVTIRTPLN